MRRVAISALHLIDELPNKPSAWVITRQLGRCAASMGANYRAASRAKSTADFINKLKIVEEEADETLYWLELALESELVDSGKIEPLMKETNELLAIIVSSLKTIKSRIQKS